ncbi:MAG: tRNA 2-thiouridine(34) synthase MnmA [Bacteroidales bacterium]
MKIAVALSGGVDSSVAAYLLKEQGHDLIAIFMQNWHDTTGTLYGDCSWNDDWKIAQLVASKLDIPLYFVDLSREYRERVIDYMFKEYGAGRTPNPDIMCNREIKFDAFLKHARSLGAEMIATGHYCRKESIVIEGKRIYKILAGLDSSKDQSYFLCQLTQEQLQNSLFPIGGLLKREVREIAERLDLPTAHRKDSQGLCFVGKIDLPLFLQQRLEAKEGDVIEIPSSYYQNIDRECNPFGKGYRYKREDGSLIGRHNGAHFYTIGQRRGLNIGGHTNPLFVIGVDISENILFVGEGEDHPGLYRELISIEKETLHWIRPGLELSSSQSFRVKARVRYRQELQEATLVNDSGNYSLLFDKAQRGVTPGQFAACYIEEELICSGVIE